MLRQIDKHLLEQVAVLRKAQEEGRQVYFLKKRRYGMTLMIQLLETEDIEHEEIIKQRLMSDEVKWMSFDEYQFHQRWMEKAHQELLDANPEMRERIVKAIFSRIIGFKEWIEDTSLFHSIVNNPLAMEIKAIDNSISLKPTGKKVEKAEDLPVELILEFYRNSPYYTINNNQKQIQ